ncbi:MAG: transposase, partial [Gammaproteobacteria bacterium]|nr:transposase [Gammaproteobacteria bacterium]
KEEGREEGREEGKKEGREEGKKEGITLGAEIGEKKAKLQTAKNLLNIGLSVDDIAKATGLSSSDIEHLN